MNENASLPVYKRKAPWIAHIVVSVLILIVAFAGVRGMFSAKPEAKRWGAGRPAPSVAVETTPLATTDYAVWLESYGTVTPLTQTELVAEVTGKVVAVSPNIRAGGRFSQGDVLVTLDSRDFKVEVDVAASEAAQANVAYLQELAEAELAARDWNRAPKDEAAKLLALRKPQVEAAKAALDAAKARLERAKLNLERTQIRAPFDGMVLTQSIDIGQVVNSSQAIATIYSTDVAEVRLPIKISELDYLSLPQSGDEQAMPKVKLYGDIGSRTYEWQGRIVRSEGAFDTVTRTLFVVAQIDNPFTATANRPPIRIGQFLRADIEGGVLNDVFVIPRQAVAQDYTVSLMQNDKLEKRKITPLWTDKESVVVASASRQTDSLSSSFTSTLTAGEQLILTPVSNLPNGTRLQVLGAQGDVANERDKIAGKQASADGGSASPTASSAR